MEDLMGDATKIRKRGCSPSSSTSSVIQNYRFKRAILVGKRGGTGAMGGGGSSTPVPTWRMVGSRSPSVVLRAAAASAASPRYPPSLSGRSRAGQGYGQPPVSARKLAATLWELNEVPSPSPKEKRNGRREKVRRSVMSGSLPPHLSDPSHSPVSESMERSGTGSHRRRELSISRRIKMGSFDSVSNASFMEIETRSRCQTPSGSSVGVRTRLKDVSNALTTSKELLKIISRMRGGHESQPSSSMSLISALHTELERARLQINQLIQEERSEHKEMNYLLKRFAEEKALWKKNEQEVVEAAVESIAGELEVERKLRRRSESLNKKLGKELAETKASFLKAVKELENEKRERGIMEQVCDELSRNMGDDKAEIAEMERESLRMHEEVEHEREMLQYAEALREERAQMKLSNAKHQFEERNGAVDKVRSQLEAFLRTNNCKENGRGSVYQRRDGDLSFCRSEARESDEGEVEVEYSTDDGGNSNESDLHSIELNVDNPNKNYKSYASMIPRNSNRLSVDDKMTKSRNSLVNQVAARRSTSMLRSMSDVVEWGNHGSSYEINKQVPRRSCGDEIQRYNKSSARGLRDHMLPTSRLGLDRELSGPISQRGPPWPSRDPCDVATLQRPMTMEGNRTRVRQENSRVEGHNLRRSRK